MGSSVEVKEALLITPASPTPEQILSLSALDSQLFVRFTCKYLLVYRCSNMETSSDRRSTTASLKAALSKALVPYYPLAGRVRSKKFSSGLEVVCHSQGAFFIEAVSDNFTIDDFDRPPKFVGEWRELLAVEVEDVLQAAPPLVVQLTWLKDGNAALAVGVNHCIADGTGSCEFLNCLTESSEFRPDPIWERHLLDPATSEFRKSNRVIDHPEFDRVPDHCGFRTRFSTETMVPTSVVFGGKSLQEMKKLAAAELKDTTSFEALSAHIWRCWVAALDLPPYQTVKLLFSINFRNRVKPRIPSGYYGNAFVMGCAQATVKDLTAMGLGQAAMLVRKAKERVDSEFVSSVLESVNESRAFPDSVGALIMSQWSSLGLHRVDFGLGQPVHVSAVSTDGFGFFLPVPDRTDAVKVSLAIPKSGVAKYESLLTSIAG